MAPKRKTTEPRRTRLRAAEQNPRGPGVEEQEVASRANEHVPLPPRPAPQGQPINLEEIQRRLREEMRAEFTAREETLRKEFQERFNAQARAHAAALPPVAPPPADAEDRQEIPARGPIRIEEGGVTMFDFLKLNLPKFEGKTQEDPRVFLEEVDKVMRRLPCSEARSIELIGLQLKGQAWNWYKNHIEPKLYVENPLSWGRFKQILTGAFLSAGDREDLMIQFERLKQGNMTVTEYASEFDRLSVFAPLIVPNEEAKIGRFLRGLNTSIYSAVASGKYAELNELVDMAKRIENRLRGDRDRKRQKNFRGQSGQTRGSSSGFQSRKVEPVLPPPPPPRQGNFRGDTRFSRGPAESSGSRRTDIPLQEKRPALPRCALCGNYHPGECRRRTGACLRCGQFGHFIRDCPSTQTQPSQPSPSQPTVQMERSMGRGSSGRGRGQGPNVPNPQPPAGRGQGRVFSVRPQEPQTSNTTITGTLLIQEQLANVLFDSGATHSFISPDFAGRIEGNATLMNLPLEVSTPLGDALMVELVHKNCVIDVNGRKSMIDLIELPVLEFDVILGMDWLAKVRATIDCHKKKIKFKPE